MGVDKIMIELDEDEFSALLEGAEYGLKLKEEYFDRQINNVRGRTKIKEEQRFDYKDIKRKTKRQLNELLNVKERIRKEREKKFRQDAINKLVASGIDINDPKYRPENVAKDILGDKY